MNPRVIGKEGGIALVVTLMLALIGAIGAAAFLHLSKTQVLQVKRESHSAKAFFAAEVGLEKAIKILKNDLYYTPEGIKPSWADSKIYTPTGFFNLQIQKYMNPLAPHYDNDFYPLVAETTYCFESNGGYKSTYKIDLSNVAGWTDRIWVKATGRFYRKSGTAYVLEARRRILALLRAKEISPWNNAVFAGEGYQGAVINGNVNVRGSVHILGTTLASSDFAVNFDGTGEISNNYDGIPAVLGARVPSIQKNYAGELLDSLEAEVRVQHGKVALSGNSSVGHPNVEGNGLKEKVEGVYVTDGYGGEYGAQSVYSDNGTENFYDLDEYSLMFPEMSKPYEGYPTYLDYLRDNALVISDPAKLAELECIQPGSVFTYSDGTNMISMDGNGLLTIQGIVLAEGNVNFEKEGSQKTLEYQGKGIVVSSTSVGVNCNVVTRSFSTYPATDLLGVMAADQVSFNSAQINVMGIFYGENRIVCQKQTSVAGTLFSNYFDLGTNVPSIYQVPDVVRNLPSGMIGDFHVWAVKKMTWGEI